ncbi:MAG: exodeoxyribonuclease VII small subunit [Bacteroides sp.]|nr:exodeoxyribonuclease VII small subunit [Bacteroides sp.]
MTFEEALKRLNEISELMEDPNITLKNAVELYSEADKLTEICNKSIKDAKLALEKIEQ